MNDIRNEHLVNIWRYIQKHPSCTGAQIHNALPIHKDTINKLLIVLVDDGNVSREKDKGKSPNGQTFYYYKYSTVHDYLTDYGQSQMKWLVKPAKLKKWLKLPRFVRAITPCINETS